MIPFIFQRKDDSYRCDNGVCHIYSKPSFLHINTTLPNIIMKFNSSHRFNGRELKPYILHQWRRKKRKKDLRRIYKMMILQFLFFFTPLPTKYLVYIRREEKWKNNCQILWSVTYARFTTFSVEESPSSLLLPKHCQKIKRDLLGVFPCLQKWSDKNL